MTRSTDPRRTSLVATVAFVAAVSAGAGLWWLHGRTTIVTDWREVARCESTAGLAHRVTRTVPATTCRGGFVRAADDTLDPGDAVVAVELQGGVGDVPVVDSLSSDHAGRRVRVTSRVASSTAGGGEGREAIAIGTLVFVALPATELPATPFTLVDDFGETTVSTVGP